MVEKGREDQSGMNTTGFQLLAAVRLSNPQNTLKLSLKVRNWLYLKLTKECKKVESPGGWGAHTTRIAQLAVFVKTVMEVKPVP